MSNVKVLEATRSGPNSRRRGQNTAYTIDGRIRVAAYVRVSTDGDEQLGSFESQKKYYEEKIASTPEWQMAGIFADEAITGTKVDKREGFQAMIHKCMNGEIDMVITKSVSRFARNTMDTLKYVRMLKDKNITVVFEKENLDTLGMNGEVVLTMLSSLAQQEVESLSGNVKMGLKMKMQRGELVGFNGCLGYDYHSEDKTLTVNPQEAETVRLIFDLYLQGYGCTLIAKQLTDMGCVNKKGLVEWHASGVMGIIKNEKYKGDVILGKTYTVDPISKRRLENFGEEDRYYIEDHHEPIVSKEVWEKAREIREGRNNGKVHSDTGIRERNTRQYSFSSMCECGYCGHKLSRRSRHQTTTESKPVWQCMNATKNGIDNCPNCKSIDESVLEGAFVEAFRLLAGSFDDVMESVLSTIEEVLKDDTDFKRVKQLEKDISNLETRKSRLTDLLIDGTISRDTYDEKLLEMERKLNTFKNQRDELQINVNQQKTIKSRMEQLRKTLQTEDPMDTFDRVVFESIVEKVIVGGYDPDGNVLPYKITFVLKSNQSIAASYDLSAYRKKQKEMKKSQESKVS